MFIQNITIQNFGAIRFYDAELVAELNFVESKYTTEIMAAMGFLICNREACIIPKRWLQEDSRISATISLGDMVYTVCVQFVLGQPQLFATDPTGADVTMQYRYALSHCDEQDGAEVFDGWDPFIPLRLYNYRNRSEWDDMTGRTDCFVDTETFRRHLYRYIHSFCPEPINNQKNYRMTISEQGAFEVFCPGVVGKVNLSETEQRLFHYNCFLNIAEFWEDIENVRDLHHEKKPLLIRNFIEYLDASVDIGGLMARTQKRNRQTIIITSPLNEESKKKWMGENNGIFLKY